MSARLVPYEKYKDSGVEWLGKIPDTWITTKMSYGFGTIGSGTTPPSDEAIWYDGGTIPWVTTGELRETEIVATEKNVTAEAVAKFTSLRVHPRGSLAIAMYGATIGRLGMLGIDATTNQACCVLSQAKALDTRFVFHWLSVFKDVIIELYAVGGGQPNISQELVAGLRLPAPTISEQQAIASYLDAQTKRIDTLIKGQQELIELLREKRQALISHAVTKGLDPNAKMKDSGVEWLGEIPEEWESSKLNYMATLISGGTPSKERDDYWNGSISWFSPKDMKSRIVFDSEDHISARAVSDSGLKLVPPDSLLFVVRGMILVRAFPVCRTSTVSTINQDMKAMELNPAMDTGFMHYYLEGVSRHVLTFSVDEAAHGTLAIRMEGFGKFPILVPPLDNQRAVVERLDAETLIIDALISEAEATITLIQERRSALISAMVTGKVREAV